MVSGSKKVLPPYIRTTKQSGEKLGYPGVFLFGSYTGDGSPGVPVQVYYWIPIFGMKGSHTEGCEPLIIVGYHFKP